MASTIVWFRKDLRLQDNPAWAQAVDQGAPIIPLYIRDDDAEAKWAPGGAARWWLHHALKDLDDQLRRIGGHLVIRQGETLDVLERLVKENEIEQILWNRRYDAMSIRLESAIERRFSKTDLQTWNGNASLLFEPWEIQTQAGQPYKVYTPFRKACEKRKVVQPLASKVKRVNIHPLRTPNLEDLQLLPKLDWAKGFRDYWTPTRHAGLKRLQEFLKSAVNEYQTGRDIPCEDGTSRLSPYLHWGQIGVREVAAQLRGLKKNDGVQTFYNELIWREFAAHVLYHFPETPSKPLQEKYRNFPWKKSKTHLKAWPPKPADHDRFRNGRRQCLLLQNPWKETESFKEKVRAG